MEIEKIKLMKSYVEDINQSLNKIVNIMHTGTDIKDILQDIEENILESRCKIVMILFALLTELEESST
jgi:hypothetical protein